MGVPSFQQLMLPALQTIGQRYDEISISGLEDGVSKALKISVEERQLRLPSGNQTLFANRLNWARSYLSKARLIELPRRGYCRATDRGRELLAEGVSEIDLGLLERYPEIAVPMKEAGWEIATHGYKWIDHRDMPPEQEAHYIQEAVRIHTEIVGERPLGFFCRGSQSLHTRELLAELGFLYDSNGLDDDLPYFAAAAAKRMLVVPYSLDCNDMKFFHPNGFVEPDQFVRYIRAALSTLLDEAERGRGGMLNIGFHLRICGRPARFAGVKGILEALDQLGDRVWVARRIDLARHWLAHSRNEPANG